jgi:hypothetical protein
MLNKTFQPTDDNPGLFSSLGGLAPAAERPRSPLRFAPGGMRQLSSARRASVSNSWFSPQRSGGENQEFAAQLPH